MDRQNRRPVSKIIGAKIGSFGSSHGRSEPEQLFDIVIAGPSIKQIVLHGSQAFDDLVPGAIDIDARGCVIAPSLCHAHVHLDKCFLLNDPKYADLEIENGDFAEALDLTSKAKNRFEEEDLIR